MRHPQHWYFPQFRCNMRKINAKRYRRAKLRTFGKICLPPPKRSSQYSPVFINSLLAPSIGYQTYLQVRLYDKRDDFNFSIVNFPFLCGNIPQSPAYGVYISQLIRYARASSLYSDFLFRSQQLTSKTLKQGYTRNKLIAAFKKFYGRHSVIVGKFDIPVTQIISDLFL